MSDQDNIRPDLRQKVNDFFSRLSAPERERLLIKCWMSHDARWFMAVAREYGLQAASRLNQIAARETGKAEAQRLLRAAQLPPPETVAEYFLIQEAFISLLGPDLLDYHLRQIDDQAFQMRVQRCFAHENVVRAGVAEDYECGILARVTGWLEVLGLDYEMTPCLGKCLKVKGQECVYTFTLPSP